MSTAEAPSFSPQLFAFLRELKQHNEREWFNANKDRYERECKEPALAFVEDLGYRLPQVAPYLTADQRSLFRIYRDTRFSKDKTPYKTHVGIYFRHTRAADTDTPGLYLHLEPREVFLGAGIWRPSTPVAEAHPRRAHRAAPGVARGGRQLGPEWRLGGGDPLKRAPAGYPADHPLIEDLKRRSFTIISPLTQRDATASGFLDTCEARAAAARPFMQFLSKALGVEY